MREGGRKGGRKGRREGRREGRKGERKTQSYCYNIFCLLDSYLSWGEISEAHQGDPVRGVHLVIVSSI